MIDFKQIEAFVWVAELGGFRAAAEKLNTTQPAISQRIAAMEHSMHVRLFERGARGIKLTEKGQELLSHAQRILDMRSEMLRVAQEENTIRGMLRLGVAETLVQTWLPRLIEELHERYPALIVEIHVDTSHFLRSQLASYQIDLALLVGTSQDPKEVHMHLCDYKLAWIASPALKLHEHTATISELGAYPVITYPSLSLPYHAVKDALTQAGIKTPRIYCCASLSTMVHLTRYGIGPSVIAPAAITDELASGKIRLLDTTVPLPDLRFYACWRDSPDSHTARTVARLARRIALKAKREDRRHA
ncbi:MAG TPA: LysR family transcriptional regulator [Burkholderiaceae bacterium]|nr:LysR family transcriptional regulator [Burkholderiaceae bacterium]